MRQPSFLRTLPVCAAVIAAAALISSAGDLDPPAGPITPTGKALTEVEPRIAINAANTPGDADSLFKITQPGSYYLTGNITGVVGKYGIEIVTSGVRLDLNGFDLAGVPAMGNFDGVRVTVNDVVNISVINGSVRNWGRDGVNLGLSFTDSCHVEGLTVTGNAGLGISVGEASTVTGCSATLNTSFGIRVARNSTISHCAALRNGSTGISALSDCSVSNCASNFNTGDGFEGPASAYSTCVASDNEGHGFDAGSGSTLLNCSAQSNTGNGVNGGFGAVARSCTVYNNDGIGINVGIGSSVTDCVARENTLGGITCAAMCLIRGNACTDSGSISSNGAGIHATSTLCRIEGNTCVGGDRGIEVAGVNNIIIKNTCSSNTINWVIAAGNDLAPIVNATENAAAVSGNTYTGNLGSTDPNANFTH